MRFINNTLSKEISLAIKIAEELLMPGSKMIEEISKKNDFKFDAGNGLQVAMNLIAPRKAIQINIYRPWYPWSKAIAEYSNGILSYSTYVLPKLSVTEIAANLLHEHSHHCGYHHTEPGLMGKKLMNVPNENKIKFSVPYYLSSNIGSWT